MTIFELELRCNGQVCTISGTLEVAIDGIAAGLKEALIVLGATEGPITDARLEIDNVTVYSGPGEGLGDFLGAYLSAVAATDEGAKTGS